MTESLVQHFLEESAARRLEREALVCGEQRLTYGELERAANRLAHLLVGAGVQRGDRVTVLLENSPEAVVAIFGVLKAGAAIMVLHPTTRRDKLASLLADAEPTAFISDTNRMREGTDALAAVPSMRAVVWADSSNQPVGNLPVMGWSSLASYPDWRPAVSVEPSDLAALVYTSGSTGQAKGVMCSHASMVAVTHSINAYLRNTEDDVILNVLPLAFGYGLYQLFLAFGVGGRVVLEKSSAFPARIVGLLESERVTALPGVPTFFSLLFKYPDLLKRDLPHLRYITNAGAALPVIHVSYLLEAFPGVQFFSMYGQTECARATYLPPEQAERLPGSVGIAIPGTEAFVAREDGTPAPPGETGELIVRGPHVMQGYWRAPEISAGKFYPGPTPGERELHTGDLFKTDEEGFLYFVSRKDDIIKCRGEKVSPKEVENAVCQLEGVAEAAVVGVPDSILGQAIRLVVVPRDGAALTEREVRAYCSRKLEDFMWPKYVEFATQLPRTENGKIDKLALSASAPGG